MPTVPCGDLLCSNDRRAYFIAVSTSSPAQVPPGARAKWDQVESPFRSDHLFRRMILSEKSATFRGHAPGQKCSVGQGAMKQFSLTGATTVFLMSTGLSGYASDVSSSVAA